MSLSLIAVLAVLTYASRAAAMVFLPQPRPAVRAVLDRVPAPLFAGLAGLSVLDAQGGLAPPPVLAAMVGGLAASPSRSLLVVLLGGLVGYAAGVWLW